MLPKPSDNTELFGMSHFFNEIVKLYDQKKCLIKFYFQEKKDSVNQH